MFLRTVACALTTALAWPATADPEDPADAVLDALRLPEILEVMREEGLAYGNEMARDLTAGAPSEGWEDTVSSIYDIEAMEETVRARFSETFGDTDANRILEFFSWDTGQRIVELELSARRALIDDDVEQSAREVFRGLDGASDHPRLDLVEEFVEANDLLEANVTGGMNASYQFYLGMVDGGAFDMAEDEILREVWSQEAETRADTREWLYGYLLMAYGPLPLEDLQDYVALSSSAPGRAMNAALFAGFNEMYDRISYALGLAAAQELAAEEL